jgi:GNAT superfamily N-acetyltransferase
MSPPPILHFTLRDGTPVALRPIVPSDRQRLLEGFEALSEESRRYRFLGPLSTLNEQQLTYLTDVDHTDHVAWGALDLSRPDTPGFGVGRFIRLNGEPDTAEFSLTVVDTVQGHGLGALLFAVLYALAPGAGIRTLRGVIARDNQRMIGWMQRLGGTFADDDDTEAVLDVPVHADLSLLPETARSFADQVEHVRPLLHDAGLRVNADGTPRAPDY